MLKRTNNLAILAGDTPWLPYASVVYDPLGAADIANNGVTVTESGLYLACLTGEIDTADSSSGDIALTPNCQGPGGPDQSLTTVLTIGAVQTYTLMWFFYMHVAVPDTFSIELDNNTAVVVNIALYELSLARIA